MLHDKDMDLDPRGLIHEAFAMENLTAPECRIIFLDWALGHDHDPKSLIPDLLGKYSEVHSNHPMSKILVEGLQSTPSPRRRKGRNG